MNQSRVVESALQEIVIFSLFFFFLNRFVFVLKSLLFSVKKYMYSFLVGKYINQIILITLCRA